jgi:preprotein translocase subunit SecA
MKMVDSLGLSEDDPIEARILSNSIENAQKRIEGMNFERRKNVLQFDEVMNQQRELIYRQRKEVIDNTNIHDNIIKMLHDVVDNAVIKFTSGSTVSDDWDYSGLREYFKMMLTDDDLKFTVEQLNSVNQDYLKEFITTKAEKAYAKQEEAFGADQMRELERAILLKVVDTHWMDHIDAMDQLRRGIGLRAYGQRDPVIEYKFEGSDMFEEMVAAIKDETVRVLLSIRKVEQNQLHREKVAQPIEESHGDEPPKKATVRRTTPKVGRNDPCPCGSGLKYKKCCGK